MCGIVGVMGVLSIPEEKAFKDLLHLDQLRGKHSTGVVAVDNTGGVTTLKEAINAVIFLQWKPFTSLMTKVNRILIGHNRYATAGAINSVNAHPFTHGGVHGVHNGTLKNQSLLPNHKAYEVDSDNIYHAIETLGVKATVGKLHGAYALVWYDEDKATLNFLRNADRSLYYATTDCGDVFWASERGMLITALDRNGFTYTIREVKENLHYSFEVDKAGKVSKPRLSEVKPYVPPVVKKPVHNPYYRGVPSKKSGSYTAYLNHFFKFKTFDARSGVALFNQTGNSFIELRVTGVKDILAGELIAASDTVVYKISEVRSVIRSNGVVSKLLTDVKFLVQVPEAVDDVPLTPLTEDAPSEKLIHDHRLAQITHSEFNSRYGACDICSAVLTPEDDLMYLHTYNQGVCGDCTTDPQNEDLLSYIW